MRSPVWLPRSSGVPQENAGGSQQDSQQRGRKRRRASDDPISTLVTATVHDAQIPSGGSTTLRGRGRRRSTSKASSRSDASNVLVSPPEQKYQKKGAGDVRTKSKTLDASVWSHALGQGRKRSQSPSRSRSRNRASTPRRRRKRTASRSRSHGREGVGAKNEKSAEDAVQDGNDDAVSSSSTKLKYGGGEGMAAKG